MIKKISFWVRLAGWTGLISGSSVLVLYQYTHNIMFLINLITIILFSAYALATANDKRWKEELNIYGQYRFNRDAGLRQKYGRSCSCKGDGLSVH